ncbi:ATP-dependent nuclease [Paenibacillus rhizoplanae]|uniref:ATP-dependent endonuclease n=1 Tax=Paenibacillus rhizoplanae TaxID=1917181 RepID=A0ABW5FK92_9BACL
MRSVAQANGGNTGGLVLDLDISEDAINTLLNQVTKAKYQIEDHFLSEASQGLGYSNMIFILLQLEAYKRNIDPLLVNIFIIEEPESHMHPQMQNVFGKYLRTYYKQKKIQGLVTTHSSEMVRSTDMRNLRVARPINLFESKIFDFSSFKESISDDPILENFYDWFYEIGFSDIVFADRVIIYEGDTERMLIRKLATLEDFQILNQQYIAFVQVGGAYAYNYRKLIEFINIKTLILTDLDYTKSANTENLIKNSMTTNATINNFYKIEFPEASPTVSDLYQWKESKRNILFGGLACLIFQGETDNFARTLEEAMLAKHYKITTLVQHQI